MQGLECQAFASGSIEIHCKGRAKVENDFKHVITQPFGENYRRIKCREADLGKERQNKRERGRETETASRNRARLIPTVRYNCLCAAKSADSSRQELIPLRIQSGLLERVRANRTTLPFMNINFKNIKDQFVSLRENILQSFELL